MRVLCSRRGCTESCASRIGLCDEHLRRLKNGVLAPQKLFCDGGCGRLLKAHGRRTATCATCRRKKTGRRKVAASRRVSPPRTQNYFEVCTYAAAHSRCRQLWGSASRYRCVTCTEKAREWAYDGTDTSDLSEEPGRMYSRFPEFYMPMCKRCHSARDAAWRRRLHAQYHEFGKWRRERAS